MRVITKVAIGLWLSAALYACSADDGVVDVVPPGETSGGALGIRGTIEQINRTRANDGGFANGDEVGVYIVNFDDNGQPQILKSHENHVDNMRFTYSEEENRWSSAYPVYWKDKTTHVDAYGYYPYSESIDDVNRYPFAVERNQSVAATPSRISTYEASDFLWAVRSNVDPSEQSINLRFSHMMAGVVVTLIEGENFEPGEWAALEKSVLVDNTYLGSFVDLSAGTVTPDTSAATGQSIIMARSGDDFRAVVIPQSVEADTQLFSITIANDSYYFRRAEPMVYTGGKLHRFSIKVDSRIAQGDYEFTLVDEAVLPWENDPDSHNGRAREFIVVENPVAGGLKSAVAKMNLDLNRLANLKVTGEMNGEDCKFIRENLPYLEALNLYDVKMRHEWIRGNNIPYFDLEDGYYDDVLPDGAFTAMKLLSYITFPKELKIIGPNVFNGTFLSGNIEIPEGVTHIMSQAFWVYNRSLENPNALTGTLTLPTTLRYIGTRAFGGQMLSGRLTLPEGLRVIGDFAFVSNKTLTGELVLPTRLSYLGENAFGGCSGLSGHLVIPETLTEVPSLAFNDTGITSVSLHDGITAIRGGAFANTKIIGDVVIPESVVRIDEGAFRRSSMSHVYLPENLFALGDEAFNECRQLLDTVKIPAGIVRIGRGTFSGCEKLEAVVLPAGLERVDANAFDNCFSLSYIHSNAVVPPALDGSAFNGVAKDNFSVEVPVESVEAYRAASQWNEFKRIVSYRGFVARPTFSNVLNAGGSRTIILNADAEWEIVSKPDWVSVSPTSGYKKTELAVTIDKMAHGSPARSGDVVFRLKDSEEHETYYRVTQYDYEYDEDQELQLLKSTRGKGVNIVLMGDGYDAKDIAEGLYLDDMKQAVEYIFDVHPFKAYRDHFNVYTAFAMSYESGVGTVNTLRDLKFDTSYGDGTSESRVSCDAEYAISYAVDNIGAVTTENLGEITIGLIVNGSLYDGLTYMFGNGTAVAICPKSEADYPNDARGLVHHELCGHGFGKLADEYVYHQAFIQTCTCSDCGHVGDLESSQALGWYRNLTTNAKYSTVPWAHLIHDNRYADLVDIWEGGYFHSKGVYRSEFQSCMSYNEPYFSTWSRQIMVERIKAIAGEAFDYEDFVAHDSREWGQDFTRTRTAENISEYVAAPPVHGHPPVIIMHEPNLNSKNK